MRPVLTANSKNPSILQQEVTGTLLQKQDQFETKTLIRSTSSIQAASASIPVASEDAEGNLIVREEIYSNLEGTTGLPREDILFAHATDRYHVDEHCPDFAVVLLHKLKQVGGVLTYTITVTLIVV